MTQKCPKCSSTSALNAVRCQWCGEPFDGNTPVEKVSLSDNRPQDAPMPSVAPTQVDMEQHPEIWKPQYSMRSRTMPLIIFVSLLMFTVRVGSFLYRHWADKATHPVPISGFTTSPVSVPGEPGGRRIFLQSNDMASVNGPTVAGGPTYGSGSEADLAVSDQIGGDEGSGSTRNIDLDVHANGLHDWKDVVVQLNLLDGSGKIIGYATAPVGKVGGLGIKPGQVAVTDTRVQSARVVGVLGSPDTPAN